ncbi:unnamed protein product [Phytomonas sp. Hart1]|nr:unnamed protein product [Phytomonas sp. Hart1]|eukprot:CCW70801.1 unnamed protein product [Phytomonas sp. isolate Hart1]
MFLTYALFTTYPSFCRPFRAATIHLNANFGMGSFSLASTYWPKSMIKYVLGKCRENDFYFMISSS